MTSNVRFQIESTMQLWCTFIWLEDMDFTEDEYAIKDTMTVSPMCVYSR